MDSSAVSPFSAGPLISVYPPPATQALSLVQGVLVPFISGQSPLDSPRDQLFFKLFALGWIDSDGECSKERTWPFLEAFGKDEHLYIKQLLTDPVTVKCTLADGKSCLGRLSLARLFYTLNLHDRRRSHQDASIFLVGGHLQEIEHKFGWSARNLQQLTGEKIPKALGEMLKKKSASDSDFRFFPQGVVSEDVIKGLSDRVIDSLADAMYWNPKNRGLRAPEDRDLSPHQARTQEWGAIRQAIRNNGLLKFNFFDSAADHPKQEGPRTSYTTVSFAAQDSKPIDLLFIQELARNNLFPFDDCQLRLNALAIALFYELHNQTTVDTVRDFPLYPESEKGYKGVWQHLVDQSCNLLRGQHLETCDRMAYVRYLVHLAKGARSPDPSLEEGLITHFPWATLPDLLTEFFEKHAASKALQKAVALRALFSMKERNCTSEEMACFWQTMAPSLPKGGDSLTDLLVDALHWGVPFEQLYALLHVLSFLNLAAGTPHTFYLFFQKKRPFFEVAEEYYFATSGPLEGSFQKLEETPEDLWKALEPILFRLLSSASYHPGKKTVLKFYAENLEINHATLESLASRFIIKENAALVLLGFHLLFACGSTPPPIIPLMNFLTARPQFREGLCPSLIESLQATPQKSLTQGIKLFQKSGRFTPKALEALIDEADDASIDFAAELVKKFSSNPETRLRLIHRLVSLRPKKAFELFFEMASTLKEPVWSEYVAILSNMLIGQEDPPADTVLSMLKVLLERPVSKDKKANEEIQAFFFSLLEKIDPPLAAEFALNGVEKEILPSASQKTQTLFESVCRRLPGPQAFTFWKQGDRKRMWKKMPPKSRNGLILDIMERSREMGLLDKLDPAAILPEQAETARKFVLKRLESKNQALVAAALQKFSGLLREEEQCAFYLKKLNRQFDNHHWAEAIETVRSCPQKNAFLLLKVLLEAIFDIEQGRFLYPLITSSENLSLLKDRDPHLLGTYLLHCLGQEGRSSAEKSVLIDCVLQHLDESTGLTSFQILFVFEQIQALLDLASPPSHFLEQLQEKQEPLLKLAASISPQLCINFLKSLSLRSGAAQLSPLVYDQTLLYLALEKNLEPIDQIFFSQRKTLPMDARCAKIISRLVAFSIEGKKQQRADAWVKEALRQGVDHETACQWLEPLCALNCVSSALLILEALRENSSVRQRVHRILEKLSIPAADFLTFLLHYRYPVSRLWVQVMEPIKKYDPLFLEILLKDASFLQNFRQHPEVFGDCLQLLLRLLSKSPHPDFHRFCRAFDFWESLINTLPASIRISIFQSILEGLLVSPIPEDLTRLVWKLDEKLDAIFTYTPAQELPRASGLGHKKTIAIAFLRSSDTESRQKACRRLLQTVESRITEDSLDSECRKDLIQTTQQLLDIGNETELPAFIQVYADHPARFSDEELVSLVTMFKEQVSPSLALVQPYLNLIKALLNFMQSNIALQNGVLQLTEKVSVFYCKSKENRPPIDLGILLRHPLFSSFSDERIASLYVFLLVLQTKHDEKYSEEIGETKALLLRSLKEMRDFSENQMQVVRISFFTAINQLRKRQFPDEFLYMFWHFLRELGRMPRLSNHLIVHEVTPKISIYRQFSDLTLLALSQEHGAEHEVSYVMVPKEFIRADPSLVLAMRGSQESEKYAQAFILLIDMMLEAPFPENLYPFLLEFVWEQLLYLCEHHPSRSDQILRLMEKALFMPWITSKESLQNHLNLLKRCVEVGAEQNFFFRRSDKLLLFRLYLEESADCFIGDSSGTIAFGMPIPINSGEEILLLIEHLIKTGNRFHFSRAFFLFESFHKVEFRTPKGITNPRVERMAWIYQAFIDGIGRNPFFQTAHTPQAPQSVLSKHFIQVFTERSLFYHATLLFMDERTPFSFLVKWMQVLLRLHLEEIETLTGLDLYHCLVTLVQTRSKAHACKDFDSYLALVEEVSKHYLLRIEKSVFLEEMKHIPLTPLFEVEVSRENKTKLQTALFAFLKKIKKN